MSVYLMEQSAPFEALSEQQLSCYLRRQIWRQRPELLVLNEINVLQGATRIDHLILGKSMHGIEIKSDMDNLTRLKRQVTQYLQVFEYLTVVGTVQNLTRISRLLPEEVGILLIYQHEGQLKHLLIRQAVSNRKRSAFSLSQLLWKKEAIDMLRSLGVEDDLADLSREQVWQKLAKATDLHTLTYQVARRLRERFREQLKAGKISC